MARARPKNGSAKGAGGYGRSRGRATASRGRKGRATPENPTFDLNSPDAWDALGATPTDSGVAVNARTALSDSPWFRGVELVSTTCAKVPLHVYRRDGQGKVRDPGHPAYQLMRWHPNQEMTAFVFWQTLWGHVITEGNGYAFVKRDGAGQPIELVALDPGRVYPVRLNGQLWYSVEGDRAQTRRYYPDQILHLKGWGFDGLLGYSVLEKAREELGMGLAARKHGTKVFRNGAFTGLILEHPEVMDKEAQRRFLSTFEKRHAGGDNAYRTAVIEEGMKVSQARPFSAREAQLLELRGLHIREIANFIGCPPHKLGDNTRQAYASMEQENQSFLDDCIDGKLVMAEQECRSKLLTEEQKRQDSHVVEYHRPALVRADLKSRYEAHKSALAGVPFRTINEVRADENLNPLPEGDKLVIPISVKDPAAESMMPVESDPESGAPPASGDGGDASDGSDGTALDAARSAITSATVAARTALAATEQRMLRRLGVGAKRAAKDPVGFGAWLDGVRAEERPTILEALDAPARVVALLEGRDASMAGAEAADAVLDRVQAAARALCADASLADLPGAVERAWAQLEQNA